MRVAIVGAGVFGAAAALELRLRGHDVWLLDPGPIPHPEAASTDISKIVRLDYGAEEHYTAMMEEALPRWRAANRRWNKQLFHETGFLLLSSAPLEAGGFEADCHRTLQRRGHALERLRPPRARFGAWSERYVDGYFNPQGGWVESAAVVAELVREARALGAAVLEQASVSGCLQAGKITLDRGVELRADRVVVAGGAWTPALLPELGDRLRAVAQPVLHFRPADPARFRPPHFVPWAADIAHSGWYGFPANAAGIVKVANHGPGQPVDPAAPRSAPLAWEAKTRAFLRESLPELAAAPLATSRVCLYCDSFDGDPWIAAHPERRGLWVAGGGSGHAFKLAPLLGPLIADALEERPNRWLGRFGWRELRSVRREAARAQ